MADGSTAGTKPHYLPHAAALLGRRRSFNAAAYTAAINGLALTGPAYTFLLFDRVLPSGSTGSLIGATALVFALYGLGAWMDLSRQRLLARYAGHVDRCLRAMAARRLPSLPAREIDAVRAALNGPAASAVCDLPWMPLCLGMLLLLHPLFAALAMLGVAAVAGSMLLIERFAATPQPRRAIGLQPAAAARSRSPRTTWLRAGAQRRSEQDAAARKSTLMTVTVRALRPALQSATLGLGVYLVMEGDCQPPSVLAAAILLTRFLSPAETMIVHWRVIRIAHASALHLADLFGSAFAPGARGTRPAAHRAPPGEITIVLRRAGDYARSATRGAARSASSGLRPTAQ